MDAPKAHPDIAIIRYPGDRLKNGSCRGAFVSMVHTCAMKKFDASDRAKGAVNRFIPRSPVSLNNQNPQSQ
jgi:hypothetical protein